MLIYIDIRMAEHPFDENGYRRVAEGFVLQIGDVKAGVKLGNIKLLAVDFCMSPRILVDVDLQIDTFRFDRSIDQSAGAVIRTASHCQFECHINEP